MADVAESEQERRKRHSQRALFDDIAGQYEESRPAYPAAVLEFVAATAGLCVGADVLEIGCGTGQLTAGLARLGCRVTAIDIGASMIARARHRPDCADVSFQVSSFEDLVVADRSLDLVISGAAFHWIDPEVAFSKSAALLRPGGWLALLGTAEVYDDPVGPALDALWIKHGDTGSAWQRRPSDPETVAAAGPFGPPECLTHSWRDTMSPAEVVALEGTRATFLGWPPGTRRAFAQELRSVADAVAEVHVTRQTSVTMAQARTRCGRVVFS